MKKSIIYLGMALVAFTNVSLASNRNSFENQNNIITNYVGTTPLCLAISKGDIELTKKFVEYGADVNEQSNGITPLMYAARYNKVEIIKILLKNGANLKTKDSQGLNALQYAKQSNATEAITYLQSINEHEKKTKNFHFESKGENTIGQSATLEPSILVNGQTKVFATDELAVLNPELILLSNSKKTFEEVLAENDKITEETTSDELYPLDFKIINSKSVFSKVIKSAQLVGMN